MRGDKKYHPILSFFFTSLLMLPTAAAEIRISEIMVAGQAVIQDEDGAYPDWIEIENTGVGPVSLNGWHLTDRADRPNSWTFPAVSIPAGGHLVVFRLGKKSRHCGERTSHRFRVTERGRVPRNYGFGGYDSACVGVPRADSGSGFDGANFLANPTPGAPNDGAIVRIAIAPQFSEAHGFKTAPFELSLFSATAGATVRYTLDGTEPTQSSPSFEGPIAVDRTTVVRAAAFAPDVRRSPVATRTYLFIDDVVRQAPTGKAPKGFPEVMGCEPRRLWDGSANHPAAALSKDDQD
jgi:hypothetical protein